MFTNKAKFDIYTSRLLKNVALSAGIDLLLKKVNEFIYRKFLKDS